MHLLLPHAHILQKKNGVWVRWSKIISPTFIFTQQSYFKAETVFWVNKMQYWGNVKLSDLRGFFITHIAFVKQWIIEASTCVCVAADGYRTLAFTLAEQRSVLIRRINLHDNEPLPRSALSSVELNCVLHTIVASVKSVSGQSTHLNERVNFLSACIFCVICSSSSVVCYCKKRQIECATSWGGKSW